MAARPNILAAGLLTLAAVAGCADEPPRVDGADACGLADLSPLPEVHALGEEVLGPRGLGDTWRLGAAGFVHVALDDPRACVQVGWAAPGDGGSAWIPEGEFGPFCPDCAQRTAALVGGGLFALPSDASRPTAGVDFALEQRACDTLHRLPEDGAPVTARVSVSERPSPPPGERGLLRVDVAVFGADWLAGGARSAAASRWVQQVEGFLADAGLRIDLHAVCTLPAVADATIVAAGDTSAVFPLVAAARAACHGLEPSEADPRVTILHVPCLRFHDPVLRVTSDIAGYVTHLPGGFAPPAVADAVLVGGACALDPAHADGVPVGLARDVAHELGHYLGLFHSVELDGATDNLADTTGDDLMNALPALATSRGLSPSQVAIVRGHPSVRWPVTGREECAAPH
jgi:hypothetical protein